MSLAPHAQEFIAESRWCEARNAWLAEHPAAARQWLAELLDSLTEWRHTYGPLA